MTKKEISKYKHDTLVIINSFCELFTGEFEALHTTEQRFIGFDFNPCSVFLLNDMYITLYDVFEFYNLGCTVEQFEGWYWSYEESKDLKRKYSLKNYVKLTKRQIKGNK